MISLWLVDYLCAHSPTPDQWISTHLSPLPTQSDESTPSASATHLSSSSSTIPPQRGTSPLSTISTPRRAYSALATSPMRHLMRHPYPPPSHSPPPATTATADGSTSSYVTSAEATPSLPTLRLPSPSPSTARSPMSSTPRKPLSA